ncbi:IS3 family transposase [Paenibacillus kribbensis]|uniref:IS3 family transposase n=1 Tax=Paenibacillus kribbensis TaxID=172713 RepID=UPI000A02FE05|nr:IS3 family transposase [Paenibacillus kribbensis]
MEVSYLKKWNALVQKKNSGIPQSTYYYHVKKWNKPDKYADVKTEMRRLFNDELKCRAGYRTMTREIRKTTPINHKTVQRLMKELGLLGY